MINNRVIGGKPYSGSQVISLPLRNTLALPVGQVVALEGDSLVACDDQHPALGVLLHSGFDHVSVGISGIFNALGQAAVGQLLPGGRGLVLNTFEAADAAGQSYQGMQILF